MILGRTARPLFFHQKKMGSAFNGRSSLTWYLWHLQISRGKPHRQFSWSNKTLLPASILSIPEEAGNYGASVSCRFWLNDVRIHYTVSNSNMIQIINLLLVIIYYVHVRCSMYVVLFSGTSIVLRNPRNFIQTRFLPPNLTFFFCYHRRSLYFLFFAFSSTCIFFGEGLWPCFSNVSVII